MIPTIDLAGDRDTVVASLRRAYDQVGFASVVGHDVHADTIAAAFAASREFHALPFEHKMAIELDAHHRGYIPIGVSTDRGSSVERATRPNQSESFMAMREDAHDAPDVAAGTYLAGPNQWPDLPGFRIAVERYQSAMAALGGRIVRLFADALDDAEGVLDAAFATPTTWLRFLRYPPCGDAPAGVYGSAPHRDFGCVTLLAQDDVGGLEVRAPNGGWLEVPARPDAFVMNVGDMLHRWSNGRLRSTPHRVVNRSDRDRFSIAFFFDPHMSTIVEPLASCVEADHRRAFDPVQFAAFVRAQLEASYDHHAR